ncbi:MAG: serine protease, partial [Jannaschia sp.]
DQRIARMTAIRRSAEGRIVGGNTATATQNPFQVALLLRSDPSAVSGQFCGGTLVSETRVVTAAHCSDFINARDVAVLGGTRQLGTGGTRVNVRRIVLHPGWNPTSFDNDVAVWELSDPIRGVPFARLATRDGATGSNHLVTGWGRLAEGGSSTATLQAVTVPLVSRANCNDANSYDGGITGNMICAGVDTGGRDSCQGDSGGPLTGGSGNSTLTGVVSWGFGCARPNLFGVYARVSASGIRTFLEDNLDLPVPEDCIGFNNSNLRVVADGSRFLLTDGRSRMRVFPNRTEADRTLAILRHYRADRTCFVGRPDPSFSYVLAGSNAPTNAMRGEDCIRHDLANLRILTEGSRITVTDGRSRMLTFPNRREAEATIAILRGKEANHICYVGRPGASFTYMRR